MFFNVVRVASLLSLVGVAVGLGFGVGVGVGVGGGGVGVKVGLGVGVGTGVGVSFGEGVGVGCAGLGCVGALVGDGEATGEGDWPLVQPDTSTTIRTEKRNTTIAFLVTIVLSPFVEK